MTRQTIDVAAPAPGIRMIGGEMLDWSDAEADLRASGRPAGSAILDALALPLSGRVLVAGPHDPALVDALIRRGLAVDVLLRSVPDARAARVRSEPDAGEAAGARVICGALDRMAADSAYDAIIALDGVDRLLTPDSRIEGYAAATSVLASLAAVGAPVVTFAPNAFGIARLVGVTDGDEPAGDEPAGGGTVDYRPDSTKTTPAGYGSVCDTLAASGLLVTSAFAVFPDRHRPALLATAAGLLMPAAPALVAAACGRMADGLRVTEPRRLARDAVHHGLGFALAAGWLITAVHTDQDVPTEERATLVLLEPDRDADGGFWRVPQVIEHDPDGVWRRHLVNTEDTGQRALGHLRRDPAELAGRVPAGALLEERLLAACAAHDNTALRGLLSRYAAAVTTPFAFADNLVDAGDDFELLDPSWSYALPQPHIVMFGACLRRFAGRLLRGGYPHAWPSDVTVDRLVVTLAAMAGMAATQSEFDAATALAAACDTAEDNVDGPAVPIGYREAVRLAARRGVELAEAREQIQWLDTTIAERNQQLSLAARDIRTVRRSMTYRLGNVFTGPIRLVARIIRKGLPK